MADNPLVPAWTPPQVATTAKWGKYAIWAGIAIAGVYFWNGFAPDMVTAIGLLDQILTDGTETLKAAAIFLVGAFLFHEVFFKSGHINRLLNLYYLHLINSMVRQVITIDPLSPIDERINSLRKDQATFEQNSERVDGLMSSIAQKRDETVRKAQDAALHVQAAAKAGKAAAQQAYANDYGAYTKASQDYGVMYQHLAPLSATLKQVSDACGMTIQKLTTERSILKDKWGLQEAMRGATQAAGKILGKSKDQVWDMADQAEDVINSKYGEELGHLEHLKNYAEPLMESIDLDNATYSEAALAQVTGSGQKMLQSTAATPLPVGGGTAQPAGNFSEFLNR